MLFQVSTVNLINLIGVAIGIGVCAQCFLHITASIHLPMIVRRYFQVIFSLLLFYITTHLIRQLMDGRPGDGVRAALYAVTFVEILSTGFLSYMMSMLVLSVTKPGRTGKAIRITLHLLLFTHAILLDIGCFNGLIYYFDESNVYHRGPGYLLSNLGPFLMLIINMALLIRHGGKLDRRVRSAFWFYMIAPVIAIVIQGFSYGPQYIIFATIVASVYMFFVILRDQTQKYQKQNEVISRLQNGLILVLADLVESRDKCTGDHVQKTAEYTRIIMEQMKKDGVYSDQLTDNFIEDVVHSAPLHDVGKIKVPDAILNKPGKLTDEEFAEIKTHTTEGRNIITSAIDMVSEESSGYLNEARNLAYCHHEKWDGKGYPQGLSGEEIPLSARIMAVADVFDALVSKRSYKDPFPFEEAVRIIQEGKGTHFDPQIVEAFLRAEDELRKVALANAKTT